MIAMTPERLEATWPVGGAVTGLLNMGCPSCAGKLTLVAPFRPTVHEARMVLECSENDRHRWLLLVRLTEMVGRAGAMGPRS